MVEGYWYKKVDDFFLLMFGEDEPENEVYRTDEIAIGYSGAKDGDYCLHKHGRPELVQKWFSNLGRKFRADGRIMDFADYNVITSNQWDCKLLNGCIDNNEKFKKFLNDYNTGILGALK